MRAFLAIAFTAMLVVGFVPTAAAHKTTYTEDGKIKIVWGFLNEPAVTWTKTGLDLILSDNATGAPISGASETLEAHLIWGDDELHFEHLRAQHGKPGGYTDVVTLTQPGLYSLKLHGTINGSAVDMTIPAAHDTSAIEGTFFPSAENPFMVGEDGTAALQAEIADLKARIAALEAKATTQSQTPATVTEQPPAVTSDVPSAGLLLGALALVGAALVLRRKA